LNNVETHHLINNYNSNQNHTNQGINQRFDHPNFGKDKKSGPISERGRVSGAPSATNFSLS